MRCVTHEHQPTTYSAIHGPKTPGARVTTTWGESSRTIAQSTPAPIAWSHLSRAARAKRGAGSRAERVFRGDVDLPPVEPFAQVPLEGLREPRRERVARMDAELLPDLRRRVDGVTVVDEVLAERHGLAPGRRADVDERQRALDDVRDQLDEAHLGD